MIEFLALLDQQIFFTINHLPHGLLADSIGLVFSAGSGFIWFFLIAIFFLLHKHYDRGTKAACAVIIAALLTHITVALLFKPWVARPRPDLVHASAITVISRIEVLLPISFLNTDYAFPSGHATMAFAGAYILSKFFSKRKYWWYTLALLVSISRIYLGKHYLSDIVGGVVLGIAVGWMSVTVTELVFHNFERILKRVAA